MTDNEQLSDLIQEVRGELERLTGLRRELEQARHEFSTAPPNRFELGGVAKYLHDFYIGTETIFRRICYGLFEELPGDENWHHSLLDQMTYETQGRPAVISVTTAELLLGSGAVYDSLEKDMRVFLVFLDGMARA